MLNISRLPLAAACFAMVVATVVGAQTSSDSSTQSNAQPSAATPSGSAAGDASSTQPSATNPTNLPATDSGTTQQQGNAPVVDPQAAGANAAVQSSQDQVGNAQTTKTQNANPTDWPAPQRYSAGRGQGGNAQSAAGGASLGVNIAGSDDGQGIVVLRVRPGTPADQMGLRPRDRILSLNGQPVGAVDEFISAIRGMAAGDQVQLSIDRGGSSRDIGGRLEAFRESIAAGEGPVGNIVGRAREILRDQPGRFGESYRTNNENMQTSYEDRGQGGARNSDVEARVARLEQQIERLTQEIHELRNNGSSSQTGGAAAQTGSNTPSAVNATPEQPPRLQAPPK
jgi:PDZ domain